MTTIPQKIQLARDLIDARVSLERKDESLEIYSTRRTRSSYDYANATLQSGQAISALALRFAATYPGNQALASKLARAGSTVCEHAGVQSGMASSGSTFGSDWGGALDSACATLKAATEAVFADVEKQAFVGTNG
jgi:hypothetical protein